MENIKRTSIFGKKGRNIYILENNLLYQIYINYFILFN